MSNYSTLIQQLTKSDTFDVQQKQVLRVLAANLDASQSEQYKLSSDLKNALNELKTLQESISVNSVTNTQQASGTVTTGGSGVVGKTAIGKIQIYNSGRYWQSGNMWISIDSNGFLFCVNGTVAARLEKTGQLYVNNEFNLCNGVVELGKYIGEPNNALVKMGKNDGGSIEIKCEHSVIRVTKTGMFQFRGLANDEDAEVFMLTVDGGTRNLPNGIHLAPNESGFPNGLCFVYGGNIIAYTHREEIGGEFVIRFNISGEIITGMPFGYIDNSIAI